MERALAFVGEYESAYRQTPPPAPPKAKPKPAAKPQQPAAPIIDPDQVDQTGEAVAEERVEAADPRAAAWLALAQALFGSAEFRYVK